jgi:hypothetical protein
MILDIVVQQESRIEELESTGQHRVGEDDIHKLQTEFELLIE